MNIQQISLQQTLELALNSQHQDYYPFALAKSRTDTPSSLSVQLALQLIDAKGIKWIEVLERQAVKNYELVYQIAQDNSLALSVLVGVANYRLNKQELKRLTGKLIVHIDAGSQLVWHPLVLLIKNYLENKSKQPLLPLLDILNAKILQSKLPTLLHRYLEQQLLSQTQHFQSECFTTIFEFYTTLSQLYLRCKRYYLAELKSLPFMHKYTSVINLLQLGFRNALDYIKHYQYDLKNYWADEYLCNQLAIHAVTCLQGLAMLTEMEENFIKSTLEITTTLMGFEFLSQHTQSIDDQLNFQYGIIHQQKGQDFYSILAIAIYNICFHMPSILRQILNTLTQSLSALATESILSQSLVKLQLLHKLVLPREDLCLELVSPVIDNLFSPQMSSQQLSLAANCRKLRVLLFYCQILKDNHFKYLLTTCFRLLNQDNIRSFAFVEAENILQKIIDSSNKGQARLDRLGVLIRQHSFFITTALIQLINEASKHQHQDRQEKIMRVVKLLRRYVLNNMGEVKSEGTKISGCSAIWLADQVERLWSLRLKHSPLAFELVQLLKLSIQLIDEDYYLNVNEHLYKVLRLLSQPQNIDIVDQLIEVLEYTLQAEQQISPTMCEILVSMQSVINYYNGNLAPLSNVLRRMNDKTIASHTLYEWPDLIEFLLHLYLNFYRNYVSQQYLRLYRQNFQELSSNFQNFLQMYHQHFQEHIETSNNLLQAIRGMPNCEWRYRFFLVLHHFVPTQGYDIYGLKEAGQSFQRGTMKLTFIYYCDKLIRHFDDNLLKELEQFNNIFMEKQARRALEQDPFYSQPLPEINTKIYIHEAFKQLKTNKAIDLMDYTVLLKQFRLD